MTTTTTPALKLANGVKRYGRVIKADGLCTAKFYVVDSGINSTFTLIKPIGSPIDQTAELKLKHDDECFEWRATDANRPEWVDLLIQAVDNAPRRTR
jgi:hypothetical protein